MTSTQPGPQATDSAAVDLLVDWDRAARTAARLSRGGPDVSATEAVAAVASIRQAAVRSEAFVAQTSRLHTVSGPPVLVVDRAGWAKANTESMRELLAPALAAAAEKLDRVPSAPVSAVGKRITATEVGALMAFLSSRILGQYDPFRADVGRLLLVAPNIVAAEREMGVDPTDFRLWVCLHEETHRVQFGANPWLAEYMAGRIQGLATEVFTQRDLIGRVREFASDLGDLLRGDERSDFGVNGFVDLLQTPTQRASMAELTAIMSLLEGHADVVMDAVGPEVVPSVATVRARFTERRGGRGVVDRVLRHVLGLDAKARQYADGARFVRGVQAQVGVDGFNRVWTSPQTLPLPHEIVDPAAWVQRVHG